MPYPKTAFFWYDFLTVITVDAPAITASSVEDIVRKRGTMHRCALQITFLLALCASRLFLFSEGTNLRLDPPKLSDVRPVDVPDEFDLIMSGFEEDSDPSTEPTAEPTAEGSIIPSAIPSGHASQVPTPEPSVVPSAIPSYIDPVYLPTGAPFHSAVPSANPSNIAPVPLPTGMPFHTPTAPSPNVPSLVPTADTAEPTGPTWTPTTAKPSLRSPTAKPTRQPTAVPTYRPTPGPGEPTWAPTRAPTKVPTAWPTAVPSPAPSKQLSPIVTFTANFTMGGLPEPELDANSQRAVVNVTASTMGIPVNTVTYVGGIATEEIQRRRRRLGTLDFSLFATTYRILAITKVVIPLSATSFTNATVLYNTITAQLQSAVESGAFTQELLRVSAAFNATMLSTVNVTSTAVSPSVVVTPQVLNDDVTDDHHTGGGSGDSSDHLSGGAIAAIVIGGFFGAVLLSLAVYFLFFVKSGLMKVADSSLVAPTTAEPRQLSVVPA